MRSHLPRAKKILHSENKFKVDARGKKIYIRKFTIVICPSSVYSIKLYMFLSKVVSKKFTLGPLLNYDVIVYSDFIFRQSF